MLFRLTVVLAALQVAFASFQTPLNFASPSTNQPLGSPSSFPSEDVGNQTITTLHLSSITSEDTYTTLNHPNFPYHQVRVKKSNFCDPSVNVYTGYLDVAQGAKHLFFYFFESRNDPDNDDVMMWINGGPGCSSSMGLLMELGPCQIDMKNVSSNGTTWNPYSWNERANIFFLDQPIGVGFSYSDHGITVETTEDAAKDVYAFISIFFETFSQFSGRPFHMSGESYGGRYLPVFASEIVDRNQVAKAEGRPTINLKSVLIGNGNTGIASQYSGRFEIECGGAALDVPFQSINTCVRMKMALPRCQEAMRRNCVDHFDAINCQAALTFCDDELSSGMWSSGRNVYDISKMCVGDDLCYAENEVIKSFLDLPSTRTLLGVESPNNFSACSSTVGRNFVSHMDKWNTPTQYYVAGLLERGIRMLIYAGTYDWQCNWVSNKIWVDAMEWSGAEEYARTEWRDWGVDGVKAGETKSAGSLTFATILGAGHMVPHDKPVESLAMVLRWIGGETL
ncbi:hypothetical protein JAAARDRAFT_28675 [Jaapia argillacea MUCL 33604]|uniref:Carboxypeptidase n=1 Tax=Jaapia argillacea MUCL 33604 TaxID=933084 RepID=A0A067QQS5_9AGAM|nr:hypothetical protein JAAARDRAFT_28675 [Jaapia argillacea MUCL 33604]